MSSLKRNCLIILAVFIVLVSTQIKFVSAEDRLTVSNISTKEKPSFALSWPKNKGSVTVERSADGGKTYFALGQTDLNFYMDQDVLASTTYVYRVSNSSISLSSGSAVDAVGKPKITAIKIGAGASSKTEAEAIVTFKTDILSTAQVYYGETIAYGFETTMEENLNQSHTIIIEKLKPATTYHLKIKTVNKGSTDSDESEDQMFVTKSPAQDLSIFQVIVDALSRAFEGFAKWFNS